jgi:metallo-beta-lactamase class B
MTRRSIAAVLVAVCLCSFAAVARGQGYPRTDDHRAWNRPFEPFPIIGNIYYVGTAELASFLITSTEGHVLIDSGLEDAATQLLASIGKLGFNARDIKVLLNTQAHFDHAAGLAALKDVSRASMVASAADRVALESGDRDDFAFGDQLTFKPVKVDRVIRDGETVTVGPTTLTAHLTPGHSKGTTSWTMVVREGGQEHRVVFAGSTSINPGVQVRNNPKYPEMFADFEKTFATLRALPVDVFLTQHAGAYGLADKAARLRSGATPNPFIDPDGYKRWIENGERNFRKLAQ